MNRREKWLRREGARRRYGRPRYMPIKEGQVSWIGGAGGSWSAEECSGPSAAIIGAEDEVKVDALAEDATAKGGEEGVVSEDVCDRVKVDTGCRGSASVVREVCSV